MRRITFRPRSVLEVRPRPHRQDRAPSSRQITLRIQAAQVSSPAADLAALRDAGTLSTDSQDRAFFSLGKGYTDLVRMRRGQIPNPTDAIVRPADEQQVLAILRLAAERRLAVIPFGGGTSVVGASEPLAGRPTMTIDTAA